MAEKSIVEFIEEWQTGAFFILGSVVIGVALGIFLGSLGSGYLGLAGFFIGTILAFFLFSYIGYGR